MFNKFFILLAALLMGSAQAQVSHCEDLLTSNEYLKIDLKKCVKMDKANSRVLSVDDSLRVPGKEVENNRAPSVEVFYRRSSKQ